MEHVLSTLIEDLERQQNNRLDIVSEKWLTSMVGQHLVVTTGDHGTYRLTNHAHEQLSQTLDIPKRYYDRLKSTNTELLLQNINPRSGKPLMFRILDDKIVAILSDRYQVIDNYNVMMCALETVKNMHHRGARVVSCELTDTKMYLGILQQENSFELITGTTVTPGILIQNSEVGEGAFRADMYVSFPSGHNMICELPTRRTHKGQKIGPGVVEHAKRDGPLWEQITNMIDAAFDPVQLNHFIARIRNNTERITGKPLETVERICDDHRLTEQQKTAILNHFMEIGDRTKYTLATAVAMTAQEAHDPDTAILLERIAGKIAIDPVLGITVPLT